jgi:hypothetical protein
MPIKFKFPGNANLTLTDGDILRWRKTNSASDYWRLVSYQRPNISLSSRQIITATGAGTYVTPAGCKQIKVRAKGGGGGGGGGGAAGTGAAGNGAVTTFNAVTANGGIAGASNNGGATGLGGTAGAGAASFRWTGISGDASSSIVISGTNCIAVGGKGGGKGGGAASAADVGIAAKANSGAGGGGAGLVSQAFASFATDLGGGGGGEAEEFELIINNPAANYAYTVGVGGTAGAGVKAGSVGGSGYLIIDEFYS